MNRVTKFSLVAFTSGAVLLSALAGATAQPSTSKNSATKITKPVVKVVPAKTTAAQKAAAKKAALKRAAAKKAAAKKAAAKRLAAKKAAAKRLAAKKAAAKKIADAKAAEQTKQASRRALLDNILDSLTPDAPTDLPGANPSETDPSGSISASMPIFCHQAEGSYNKRCDHYGPRIGKPTAQLLAFNEAMTTAQNDYHAATQLGYLAFESATSQARDTLNEFWLSSEKSFSQAVYMQIYLDYLVAIREPQAELNAVNVVANQALTEAKYAALADYDAATFDASTESGASALEAIYVYRKANKSLELEQYATSLSDSSVLNDSVNERMQAYLNILATLETEREINDASNTYYGELSELYLNYSINSNEHMRPFYESLQAAEDAFVALTGDVPSHPDYYPYWWHVDGDDRPHPIDPLPPVDGEDGDKGDEGDSGDEGSTGDEGDKGDVVYCLSLDCPRPDRPMPVDPTVPDNETETPEIIICPPAPPEIIICEPAPPEIIICEPAPVEEENSDSDNSDSDNSESEDNDDSADSTPSAE